MAEEYEAARVVTRLVTEGKEEVKKDLQEQVSASKDAQKQITQNTRDAGAEMMADIDKSFARSKARQASINNPAQRRAATAAEKLLAFGPGKSLSQFGTNERGATKDELNAIFGDKAKAGKNERGATADELDAIFGPEVTAAKESKGARATGRIGAAGKALGNIGGAIGGESGGALASAGEMLGGPVGLAIAGVALLGTAAIAAVKSLNRMSEEQVKYNRSLSQASAQMAFVFAERDIQERMRDREKGDRLSTSARALTQAEQFKEENQKEISILWNKSVNYLSGGWEVFKGALFMQLNQEAELINKLLEFFTGGTDTTKNLTMDEWARDAQRLDEEARKRKDPKWMPPKFR